MGALQKNNVTLQLVDLWGLDMEQEVSTEEEAYMRSVIGSLQWSSSSVRPDMAFSFGKVLGDLNRFHKKQSLSDANDLVARYNAYGNLNLKIIPLRGRIDIEVYGDSALSGANAPNHQGVVVVLREAASENVNFISWRSRTADQKAWSSLAGETFVLQQALDKLVHIHAVLRELKVGIHKSSTLTDILKPEKMCLFRETHQRGETKEGDGYNQRYYHD